MIISEEYHITLNAIEAKLEEIGNDSMRTQQILAGTARFDETFRFTMSRHFQFVNFAVMAVSMQI